MSKSVAPALDRGLAILEALCASAHGELGFKEITRHIELPDSTAIRLLKVLSERGYIAKTSSGKYCLGEQWSKMAQGKQMSSRESLAHFGKQITQRLWHLTHNTTAVFWWSGELIECIAKHQDENSLGMQQIGEIHQEFIERPWAWLFYTTLTEERQASLDEVDKVTPEFPKRQAALKALDSTGYVYLETGKAHRMAAPIRNDQGIMIGALVIGGTPSSLPSNDVPDLARALLACAKEFENLIR